MARRSTVDMPADRAAAWQEVIREATAEDEALAGRLAFYVIRREGQRFPIGTVTDGTSFASDPDREALTDRLERRQTLLHFRPYVPPFNIIDVPEGSVGAYFISDATLSLAAMRDLVDQRVADRRVEQLAVAAAAELVGAELPVAP